jgi:hypothetical protein
MEEYRIAYQAKFEPIAQGEFGSPERHYVKVWNIDSSWNNNNWRVTAEARARSLGSFFNQKLLGPLGLSSDVVSDMDPTHPHYGIYSVVGKPVDVIHNGTTYGVYEITSPLAWDWIQQGRLGAVSPSVLIKKDSFDADGKQTISDFAWDHTLFVDTGAFPKAGVVDSCTAADPSLCGFAQAAQAAYLERRQAQFTPVLAKPYTGASPDENDTFPHNYAAFVAMMQKKGMSQEAIDLAWHNHMMSHQQGQSSSPGPAETAKVVMTESDPHVYEDFVAKMKQKFPDASAAEIDAAWHTHMMSHQHGQGQKPRQDVADYSPGRAGKSTEKKQGDSTGGRVLKTSESFAQADPLTTDQRNNLDDSDFAYIDSDGGRHLPINDADHVRAALGGHGISAQSFESAAAKAAAIKKICAAAKKYGIQSELCGTGQGKCTGENHMSSEEDGCRQAQAKVMDELAQAKERIKHLEQTIQARDDAELTAQAAEVVDLMVQAKLVPEEKRADEVTRHKAFGIGALREMKVRYGSMLTAMQASRVPGRSHELKATFDEVINDPAQASDLTEQIRQASCGRTRTAEEIEKLERLISGGRPN